MNWDKIKIQKQDGEIVDAQAPIIISASRSTDIPAFYSDWFFHRLKVGYSAWTNPFNNVRSYVSYQNTRLIVFWSKNPKPLIKYLDELKERNINCYIQFTINDYVSEGLEQGVPSLDIRINTFRELVSKLGKGKVIWRFDPLILTDNITVNNLLEKAQYIGEQLHGYAEKMVFSFADILVYRKVKSNLDHNNVNYKEFTVDDMNLFSKGISELNQKWNYELATCCEKIPLEPYGIQHNRCIDDDLMIKLFPKDKILLDFLGAEIIPPDMFSSEPQIIKKKNNKDKGQRELCGCINSKDIGEYNTCPHQCQYCYANTSKKVAFENFRKHKENKFAETITGKVQQ